MAQKGLWNVAREKMLKTDALCLKKMEINRVNTKSCMKKTVLAVGCVRMWKEEKLRCTG